MPYRPHMCGMSLTNAVLDELDVGVGFGFSRGILVRPISQFGSMIKREGRNGFRIRRRRPVIDPMSGERRWAIT